MKTIILKKGAVICHTSINYNINFMTELPGKEKGAYFSFEKPHGGERKEIEIYYELQNDVELILIPKEKCYIFKSKNPEFYLKRELYPEEKYNKYLKKMSILKYSDGFKPSFKVSQPSQILKKWEKRGYSSNEYENKKKYSFSFITYDFCEIFLTFEVMKKVLSTPKEILYSDPFLKLIK